jgi:hypothetical protein
MTNSIPTIDVGIMYEKEIHFSLHGAFRDSRNDILTGDWKVWYESGNIYLSNSLVSFQIEEGFALIPENANDCSVHLKRCNHRYWFSLGAKGRSGVQGWA